jgi:hypothetical protein
MVEGIHAYVYRHDSMATNTLMSRLIASLQLLRRVWTTQGIRLVVGGDSCRCLDGDLTDGGCPDLP